MWAVMNDTSPKVKTVNDPSSSSSTPRRQSSVSQMIPRSNDHAEEGGCRKLFQQSATVNVPERSGNYGKKGTSDGCDHAINVLSNGTTGRHAEDVDDGSNDDDEGMIPPHEWVDKKLANSQISSFDDRREREDSEGQRSYQGEECCSYQNRILGVI